MYKMFIKLYIINIYSTIKTISGIINLCQVFLKQTCIHHIFTITNISTNTLYLGCIHKKHVSDIEYRYQAEHIRCRVSVIFKTNIYPTYMYIVISNSCKTNTYPTTKKTWLGCMPNKHVPNIYIHCRVISNIYLQSHIRKSKKYISDTCKTNIYPTTTKTCLGCMPNKPVPDINIH